MTFLQKFQCTCMWKYLSSENKVIKDDNHLILILIYDIFAEQFMDVEKRITDGIIGRNKKDVEWFESQGLVLYICYLHYVNFVLLMDTKPVISGLSLLSN